MRRSVLFFVLIFVAHRPALGQPTLRDAHGLTVYRPQHGPGYLPFARTPVPEEFEEHPRLGPGIRVNRADEMDSAGEDDLIELVVTRPSADTSFVLERSHSSLSVWKTREKLPQTALDFTGGRSTQLVFGHIGTFSISFTSYVDGIRNEADIDPRVERRRPPMTSFHANQYQQRDWLQGGPVAGSTPPPTGLRVALPGERGGDTWGDLPVMFRAGSDSWIPGSYDPVTRTLFHGTSQAKPWARVVRGTDGAALYTNSTLALDPDTGEMK